MMKSTLPITAVVGIIALAFLWPRGDAAPAGCRAIDGDTLDCSSGRIRLNGIDAPEIGPCRPGRHCVDGDPWASRDNLTALIGGPGDVRITYLGTDRYGRRIANIRVGNIDVSCAQIAGGFAVYVPRWDTAGETWRRCPQ